MSPGVSVTDEHLRFLADHSRVYLVVRRQDGTPMAYPMTGRWEDGGLEFSTYRKSAKVRHIEGDDRVCCLTVPRDRTADRRALAVWGRATIAATSRERWQAAVDRDVRLEGGFTVPAEVRAKVADRLATNTRVIVRVEPMTAAFVA